MCEKIRPQFWPGVHDAEKDDDEDKSGAEEENGSRSPEEGYAEQRKKKLEQDAKKLDEVEGIVDGSVGRSAFQSKNLWSRAKARSGNFDHNNGQLYRVGKKSGARKRVLKTWEEMEEAVLTVHQCGHFGRDPVLEMVKEQCWWKGNM